MYSILLACFTRYSICKLDIIHARHNTRAKQAAMMKHAAEYSTSVSRPLVFKNSTSIFGRDVKYCKGCGQGTTKDDRATCKACGLSSWISRRIKDQERTGHTEDTKL